ncbi:hypothetical protein KSP40_PGU009216 [Platanthera guangdongensis]|uniref:Uncharacterized protein n=1 Tax=Platanthera guangdongensis TaxID=2320717 RepID=A0ABR2MH62_9ASPA
MATERGQRLSLLFRWESRKRYRGCYPLSLPLPLFPRLRFHPPSPGSFLQFTPPNDFLSWAGSPDGPLEIIRGTYNNFSTLIFLWYEDKESETYS